MYVKKRDLLVLLCFNVVVKTHVYIHICILLQSVLSINGLSYFTSILSIVYNPLLSYIYFPSCISSIEVPSYIYSLILLLLFTTSPIFSHSLGKGGFFPLILCEHFIFDYPTSYQNILLYKKNGYTLFANY
jgi:hypothetical protein